MGYHRFSERVWQRFKFDLKRDSYTKALENIFDNEKGLRKERARVLLDNYRKASKFFIGNFKWEKWRDGDLLGRRHLRLLAEPQNQC